MRNVGSMISSTNVTLTTACGDIPVEQRRVYSIYYYGTLTLPYKRRGERAVEAVAVRVDSGREQETFFFLHTLQASIYTIL